MASTLPASNKSIQEVITVEENKKTTKKIVIEKTVKSGVSFGSALAMVISYTAYQSILWAIIHGLLGWIYVIYYILRYKL